MHGELKGCARAVALGIGGVEGNERGDIPQHKELPWSSIEDCLWGRAGVGAGNNHRARFLALARQLVISHALIVVAPGAEASVPVTESLGEGLAHHALILNEAAATIDGGDLRERSGRGERIRTSDLLLPKQARYQAAPHPDLHILNAPLNRVASSPYAC